MRTLLARHRECLDDLLQAMGVGEPVLIQGVQQASTVDKTDKGSSPSEPAFTHYKSTTQGLPEDCSREDTGFQESVAAGSEETGRVSGSGVAHVTLGMALGAASDRLKARVPAEPGWEELVAAAYDLRRELGVSQASWAEACELLGRSGAAIGLLVADRAALREIDPVRCPAAYFRGLVSRARRGELRLHASVFGLLERGSGAA
jgi:replication initiation protein RepC